MEEFDSFRAFLKQLIKEKKLVGHRHEGLHVTVNTQKDLSEAEKNVAQLSLGNK